MAMWTGAACLLEGVAMIFYAKVAVPPVGRIE
jgi:hypothetical protein